MSTYQPSRQINFLPELIRFKEVRLCSQSIKLIRKWVRNSMWEGSNLREYETRYLSCKSPLPLSPLSSLFPSCHPCPSYDTEILQITASSILFISRDGGFCLATATLPPNNFDFNTEVTKYNMKTWLFVYIPISAFVKYKKIKVVLCLKHFTLSVYLEWTLVFTLVALFAKFIYSIIFFI